MSAVSSKIAGKIKISKITILTKEKKKKKRKRRKKKKKKKIRKTKYRVFPNSYLFIVLYEKHVHFMYRAKEENLLAFTSIRRIPFQTTISTGFLYTHVIFCHKILLPAFIFLSVCLSPRHFQHNT